MVKINDIIERLKKLQNEGETILNNANYSPDKYGLDFFPEHINNSVFINWQTKCISYLETILNKDDFHIINFKDNVKRNSCTDIDNGVSIIKVLIGNIENNTINLNVNNQKDEYLIIENIFNRFHRVAKQLTKRYNNRQSIEIHDEYDVQDLLHALLLLNFDYVKAEEYTPIYAGKNSRVDFLVKDINVFIETKMTRQNLKDNEIADQLIIDKERYANHPDCDKLYCFVYDKGDFIDNPIALEEDLSKNDDGLEVKVIVEPKF